MKLTFEDLSFLAICLEGFWYGIYSAIFAMYLQYHASKYDGTDQTKNRVLFYTLVTLYVLSLSMILFDITSRLPTGSIQRVRDSDSGGVIFGLCDFISQSILIYRCWIVWGRKIHIVIIPSILAIVFLATWLVGLFGANHISSGQIVTFAWGLTMIQTSLAISLTVNALVMGLIVFKIFKVFRVVKPTSGEKNMGATGGSKLRSIIFVLIESSMALFSIQLARLVLVGLYSVPGGPTEAVGNTYEFITPIHQMFTGITPTIILVRVSMGLSFHDETSMVEVASALCFQAAPGDLRNSIPETGSISIGREENLGDNDIGIRLSSDV